MNQRSYVIARMLVAGAAGILFAVGLAISGMTIPANIIGFLDLFGDWRPQLALVMGGAIMVNAPVYWLMVRRSARPRLRERFELPTATRVDGQLLAGAGLFGVGWGIAGFCPGPALVSLGSGATTVLWFVAAMAAGMLLVHGYNWLSLLRIRRTGLEDA